MIWSTQFSGSISLIFTASSNVKLFPVRDSISKLVSLLIEGGKDVWTGIGAVGTVLVGIIVFKEPADFWRLFFLVTLISSIIGLKMVSH